MTDGTVSFPGIAEAMYAAALEIEAMGLIRRNVAQGEDRVRRLGEVKDLAEMADEKGKRWVHCTDEIVRLEAIVREFNPDSVIFGLKPEAS